NPKYQPNNVNPVPKAIPIIPSALKDGKEHKEHHRYTFAATAKGVFNSYDSILSSIGIGVSIFIPQGIFRMD
ncbi:hypothetical protein Nmel_000813, partial [Mimus melanotis]